jgi:F-type H+-transporting ATPase subunit delta
MPAVDPAAVAQALHESLTAILRDQGAEDQFDAVVEQFFARVRGSGPRDAEITSAVPLTPEQTAEIERQLHEKYGPALDIKFVVDASILGGLIFRVGDKVLDDSVRNRLTQVQQRMLVS